MVRISRCRRFSHLIEDDLERIDELHRVNTEQITHSDVDTVQITLSDQVFTYRLLLHLHRSCCKSAPRDTSDAQVAPASRRSTNAMDTGAVPMDRMRQIGYFMSWVVSPILHL